MNPLSRMSPSLHIFFLFLEWLPNPCFVGACHDRISYRKVFTADVLIDNPMLSFSTATAALCGIQCRRLSVCRSFAVSPATSHCWLYDHLAEFSLFGKESMETSYFWMLSAECPAELGYTLEGDICYRVGEVKKDWDEAHKECMMDGGHLFIGDELSKLNLLMGKFTVCIWLGASDVEVEGEWYWVDGNRLPLQSEIWRPLRPNNLRGEEHFLQLRDAGDGVDDGPRNVNDSVACQIPVCVHCRQ